MNNAIAEQKAVTDPESKLKIAVGVRGNEKSLRGVAQAQAKLNCNKIESIYRKIEQKQEIANCPGTNGKLLEVAITNSTKETREAVAQALVNDSLILGVVGRYTSPELKQVNSIYAVGKLVVVAPTSNATRKSLGLDPNYIFRVVPDASFTVKHLKELLKKRGQYRFAIFKSFDDEYSGSLVKEVSNEKDLAPLVLDEKYCNLSLSEQDFRVARCIEKVKAQGIKTLLLIPAPYQVDNAITVIKHVSENNLILTLRGSDTLYDKKVLEDEAGEASKKKLVITVPWARTDDNSTEFEKDAETLWGRGSLINWRTAMSYDATQVILKGLKMNPNPPALGCKKRYLRAISG